MSTEMDDDQIGVDQFDDCFECASLSTSNSIGGKRISTESLLPAKRFKRTFNDLKNFSFNVDRCKMALYYDCPCGEKQRGVNCLSLFNTTGEILNARMEHYDRTAKEEYKLRAHDVLEAYKHQKEGNKARVSITLKHGIKYSVCLNAYAALYELPLRSFWRTVGDIRKRNSPPTSVGRPKGTIGDANPVVSLLTQECLEWIRMWAHTICDESPTTDDWSISIDPVDVREVHEEYECFFKTAHISVYAKVVSFTTFVRVWNHWLIIDRVKIRNKGNTTTKCDVCENLRVRARAIRATKRELDEVKKERKKHRDDIRALREYYHKDVLRASYDATFATVIFDGTDSSYCMCPQSWRGMVRMEQSSDSHVEQKIQSVLIHNVGLFFYVVVPFVTKGMDLTVSVLLDALTNLPPTVETVRFQFDGMLNGIS